MADSSKPSTTAVPQVEAVPKINGAPTTTQPATKVNDETSSKPNAESIVKANGETPAKLNAETATKTNDEILSKPTTEPKLAPANNGETSTKVDTEEKPTPLPAPTASEKTKQVKTKEPTKTEVNTTPKSNTLSKPEVPDTKPVFMDNAYRPEYTDVTRNRAYAFLYAHLFPLFVSFYAWTIQGRENIPLDKDARILFIGYHSNHNWDIAVSGMSIRNIMNEVPVGLMHRTVVAWCPWVKSFGCISGTRSSAINAYKRGHRACMVIPGGAEEALMGHENAYTVDWKSSKGHLRTGFAQLAMDADAVIIPVVVQNLQEMVFNPLFFLLNVTYFSKAYDYLIALPGWIGWLFLQIKMYTWMWFSMLPVIPMPVKAGVIFGTPLHHEKDETVEHYAVRVSHEYEKLVHQVNPGGLNYTRALRARFNL